MILERKLEFPEYSNKGFLSDCRDLIDKLLRLKPSERLGAGPEDSDLSFQALKSHPFFEGIDFEKLSEQEVPVDKSLFEVEEYEKFLHDSVKSF